MIKLKLTRVGVVIPKEMLAKMNVREGDSLCAVEAPDGSYRLIPVPFDSFAGRPSLQAKRSNPGAAATLWIASPVLRSRVCPTSRKGCAAMTGRANEVIKRKLYDAL